MKLRKCPFCGGELNAIDFNYHDGMKKWCLFHSCFYDENFANGVSVSIYGKKQDVIDKWNGVYEDKKSESL